MLRTRTLTRTLAIASAFALPYVFPWKPAEAQQAVRPDLLVSPQWLNEHVKDKNLVVLQVGPKESYDKQHIAGAHFIELMNISTPRKDGELSLEMPSAADLRATFEKLGISDNSHVVVVPSDEWNSPSTRVMLTLDYIGLGDRSSLLDGGIETWKRMNFPVSSTATAAPTAGHLSARPTLPLIVDYAFVQSHASTPHLKVIDARAPVFFNGPAHGEMMAGHIPGSVNLPFDTFYGDSSRLLKAEEIASKFRAAGLAPGDTVVAYCHVGQQGTVVVFAARLLGHPARLYDGSFEDWNKRKLPVEGGTAK